MPLLLVLLVAGCGQAPAASADGPKSALGFTAHAGAVQFPADGDWVASNVGLKKLVPVGGCVLGLGNYSNGYRNVTANWTGDAACSALKIDPAPGSGGPGPEVVGAGNGWRGGGLPAVGAVPAPDGSVLGVSTKFTRRDADGTVTELAELRGQRDPGALARSGGNLVAVGTAFLDAQTTRPVAWVSDDEGKTERTVVMPVVPGVDGANGPWSVAANGAELLAAGYSNPRLQIWASHDGGGSWTVSELSTPSDQTLVYGILPVAGQWLLYGEVSNGFSQNRSWSPASRAHGPLWTLRGRVGSWRARSTRTATRCWPGGLSNRSGPTKTRGPVRPCWPGTAGAGNAASWGAASPRCTRP
ncbi:hypothetical protein CF165_05725 [Amycolatopsis vastitatis]|uniref:Exo-alpha-sialidase n=1 Tax=Amycolatopsis vastitatis TaxID=1905142 RepID=A0A229TIK9_9PSEU|nr:hypothetical protein CF165_05725 [Amycolatopsis vastitatis]